MSIKEEELIRALDDQTAMHSKDVIIKAMPAHKAILAVGSSAVPMLQQAKKNNKVFCERAIDLLLQDLGGPRPGIVGQGPRIR
jgi:hypothetical protein